MSTPNDLEVARDARRIMVKHWIDLGRLAIRSSGGRLSVYGTLQRISGVADPLTPAIVESMFRDIAHIRGVRFLTPHLENWSNQGGLWHAMAAGAGVGEQPTAATPALASAARPASSTQQAKTFEMTKSLPGQQP
jgi:hypothetical protein